MAKIENDHQLEITKGWIERFRRVLEGYQTADIHPDIRKTGLENTRFLIQKLEREIEEYLAQKTENSTAENTSIQSASV